MSDVLSVLQTAAKRDAEKNPGCNGLRSTAEVAHSCGISTAKARRLLEKHFQAGEVDAAKEGRDILWRMPADALLSALEGRDDG